MKHCKDPMIKATKSWPTRFLSLLLMGSLLIAGSLLSGCGNADPNPDPKPVQVVNPMLEVASLEEMEEYLDFSVPTLDSKEVKSYIVLVIDSYPTIGRVYYEDGATFSIQYGTGDISGIYGGSLDKTEPVKGVNVSYYTYDTIRYALWETGGFTHSLTGGVSLENEVAALIP